MKQDNMTARVGDGHPVPTRLSAFGLTAEEARADLEAQGISVTAWARLHGFDYRAVCMVLAGKNRCRYGKGHLIAVALGMKPKPADRLGAGLYRRPV